jgi:hypothetical protein
MDTKLSSIFSNDVELRVFFSVDTRGFCPPGYEERLKTITFALKNSNKMTFYFHAIYDQFRAKLWKAAPPISPVLSFKANLRIIYFVPVSFSCLGQRNTRER